MRILRGTQSGLSRVRIDPRLALQLGRMLQRRAQSGLSRVRFVQHVERARLTTPLCGENVMLPEVQDIIIFQASQGSRTPPSSSSAFSLGAALCRRD